MRTPPSLKFRTCGLLIASVLFSTPLLHAQMVPGSRAIGEASALELDRDHKAREYSIEEIHCSVPANVLWPGDKAEFQFRITNLNATPLNASGKIEVIQYGTRGKPGDIWEPIFFKIGEVDSIPVSVALAPHASTIITVEPKIPETFGGYVMVADLEGHGRAFAASAVRSIRPDDGAVQFPAYALDMNGSSEEVARFFKRLGVKGARLGMDAVASNDKDYEKNWATQAKQLQTLQQNEITTMITTGASGKLPMPLNLPRPHLTDDGTFMDTKCDWSWLPSADGEFEAWVKKICGTYGWPKGPIDAMELWNEPWDGISISGWGADMTRYREIYTAMAHGIEKARTEDGAQVLIGGCGSSSNTMDKLFGDGSDEFLKWLDFCSIHYQFMSASPALMKNLLARKGPNGPVRTWDTESWIANSEDRVGLVVASMHAMGQERAMGVYAGNVYDPRAVKLDSGQKDTIVQSWSTAAAVGASTKFVGQRKFHELLFQNGLPWVFVFDGRPGQSADDGTVVVAGDLSGVYARNLLMFRTVFGLKNEAPMQALKKQLDALPANAPAAQRKELQTQFDAAGILDGGNLTIPDGGGEFVLSDFYGNAIPSKGGKIIVPLNGYGYYLRTNGKAGSFERLLDALRKGDIEGYEPVEIIPHDLTARVDTNPELHLKITNVLNRTITGQLAAKIGETSLAGQDVKLAANETKDVIVDTKGVAAVTGNAYPLHVEFDAGADGNVTHDETVHANVIAKKTITVDGKLDDWDGVVPQTLSAEGIGANLTEKAWLPFNKFDDSVKQGLATGYLAYDDKYFYFAARISDTTPDAGMMRFETRGDDQFFYPEVSQRIDENASFAKTERTVENAQFHTEPLQLPQGDERSNVVWESVSKAFAFDLHLPSNKLTQTAFYLLSWDPLGRHFVEVEISDADTKKVLVKQSFRDFGDGKYIVCNLSGNLHVKIMSNNWLKGVLSGMFFDAAKDTKPVSGTTAKIAAIDTKTRGNWKGVYGADGYAIAGMQEKLPMYAQLAFSTQITKQSLNWPDGVRRFSYRKRPALPAGGPDSHDNVQIAFNVLSDDQKPWLPSPPGTPPHWMIYWDTDYEYAFNEVAKEYGGGTEIWRLQTPGMPRKHFYPRQPKSPFDGPVKNGKLVMRRDGNTRIVEAALPWTEIPEVKKCLDEGKTIKFDFRVNDNGGPSYELATDRSVSKANCPAFHNDWQTHWANELEFGFEK